MAKVRNGFVSNSSSSSFIIKKEYLTPLQIISIWEHEELSRQFDARAKGEDWLRFDVDQYGGWNIEEDDTTISGNTSMDNFSMSDFLDAIGVPEHHIEWRSY